MQSEPTLNPNLIWRVVDGEAILLDTATGYHFSLDPIGTEIWQGLQSGESVDAIVARISTTFGAEPAVVRNDVSEFLNELKSARLLT
jgi:hypothetical protein